MEFCTLGVHNDTRGKDSVGIYIDGKTEYYCNGKGKSLFEDFIPKSNLLQTVEEAQIAYGHDRAASVGNVSIETAQPVVIKNGDKVAFVLMHNGTIYNYEALAKKYIPHMNISDMTDSQVMAHIFYNAGYDALGEYIGGAVFAIIDYREDEPRFLFWKGSSKISQYSTAGETEERPLYFLLSDEELMFSSLNQYMNAFRRNAKSLTPSSNMLIEYKIDLKDFVVVQEYDRSNCYQSKTYNNYYDTDNVIITPYNSSNNNSSSGYYTSNYITYNNNICVYNGKPIHGKQYVSNYGYVGKKDDSTTNNEMWFFEGVMLKNQAAFTYLTKFCYESGITTAEMMKWYQEMVYYLSPYPFISENGYMFQVVDPITKILYSGDVPIPFTTQLKTYKNGVYQNLTTTSTIDSLLPYKQHKDDKIDIERLMEF